jgi:hypothetical protein
MGLGLLFDWFGKPLSELLAFKELHYDKLSDEEKAKLDKAIEEKRNEE